ncbi:MAG TPA: Nramp family divalent metal transporter [Longimicrobiales bacterium]
MTTTTAPAATGTRRGRLARLRTIGPGAVVAAAFIGPGTVTTATLAGVRHGYTLLWALTFSTFATVVLQEMSARLGLVTGAGLGEAIRGRFGAPILRWTAVLLVISAVAFGNAAYEAGNLLGTALGVGAIVGGGARGWALVAAVVAFLLLWTGSYRLLERALVGMVALMSLVFLATAVVSAPPLAEVARGLLVPALPEGERGLLVAVGLIGTTVVPYNLFLHAAAVRERWEGAESLAAARTDLGLSIVLGGVVSVAIVVTSAVAQGGEPADAAAMAVQLDPLLGSWARIAFALGLLAAGLSSAITAPLAAAYATAGALGWPRDLRDRRLRGVWLTVVLAGALSAISGVRPIQAILFAQVANGVLLPAVAVFLLLAANDRRRMGRWANGPVLNIIGAVVVLVTLVLGAKAVIAALG